MNNTFKLWYKECLWKKFTDLYYDKMITLERLFKLSNSKNLYNHVKKNNNLEFTEVDIFEEIKNILKENLDGQLHTWEKQGNNIPLSWGTTHLKKNMNSNFSSYTPETKLEDAINYTPVDDDQYKSDVDFTTYLLNNAGANHKKEADRLVKNPNRYGNILPYKGADQQIVNQINVKDNINIDNTLNNEVYKLDTSQNFIDSSFMYHIPGDEKFEIESDINNYFESEVEKIKKNEIKVNKENKENKENTENNENTENKGKKEIIFKIVAAGWGNDTTVIADDAIVEDTNLTPLLNNYGLLSDEVDIQKNSENNEGSENNDSMDNNDSSENTDSMDNNEFTDYMLLSDKINEESNSETGIIEESIVEPLLKLSMYDTQCYK